MKLAQLHENSDQEPLMITILRNALAKGKVVRVYYRGEGGQIRSVKWQSDKQNLPAISAGLEVTGVSSFHTVTNEWVLIGDRNLEKLVLSKYVDKDGVEHLTLKQEAARPIKEGMNAGREWVDTLDAEFKAIVTGAGWMLKRPAVDVLDIGYFGGTLRATASAKRSLLTLPEQHTFIMKMLARKLLELSKTTSVTVAPYAVKKNPGSLQVRPHTTIEHIIDTWSDGMFLKFDGTSFDLWWSVAIPKDIVNRVTTEFSKAQTRTQDADE